MQNSLNQLKSLVDVLGAELDTFMTSKKKVSATRSRAQCLQIKKLTDQLRKDILAASKALPVKSRTSKAVEQVEAESVEEDVDTPVKPKKARKLKK